MSAAPRLPRLTPHQREVFERIRRHGAHAYSDYIGSRGAVEHLIEKGYIVRHVHRVGPRGGITYRYEITEAAR